MGELSVLLLLPVKGEAENRALPSRPGGGPWCWKQEMVKENRGTTAGHNQALLAQVNLPRAWKRLGGLGDIAQVSHPAGCKATAVLTLELGSSEG